MAVTKERIKANNQYRDRTFDRLELIVKKGKKAEYKQAAEVRGIGLMELARRGIEEYILNHPVQVRGDINENIV